MTDPTVPDPATSKGLTTGQKVLIGCLGATVMAVVAVVALIGVGGFLVKDRVGDFVAGAERQQEASETLERLAEDHPFDAPEDGVVTEDQVDRFVAVTNTAWEGGVRPWAEEVAELEAEGNDGQTGLGALARGASVVGGLAAVRADLAEALDEHDTSLGEYLWTGISMARARDAAESGDPEGAGVPAENVRLFEARRSDLAMLVDTGTDEPSPGVVLGLAMTWGMADPAVWRAYGLDTLDVSGRR